MHRHAGSHVIPSPHVHTPPRAHTHANENPLFSFPPPPPGVQSPCKMLEQPGALRPLLTRWALPPPECGQLGRQSGARDGAFRAEGLRRYLRVSA